MAIQGDLQEMNLPNLVQLILHSGGRARILIHHGVHVGALYIADRQLQHATLTVNGHEETSGPEAVYQILCWETGQFKVERAISPPRRSLEQSWDFLLMEGLRRLDESRQTSVEEPQQELEEASLADLLQDLNADDAEAIQDLLHKQEKLQQQETKMSNIQQTLNEIMALDGAIATALVDWQSGMTLGTAGTGLNIELAAAGNTNVVRAKLAVMKDLGIKGNIEDILITLTDQYHLLRLFKKDPHLFLYVAIDKQKGNLGLARHRLNAIETSLEL